MGTDIFNVALDALMVVAITGLWVMWFQQTAQRKKVEKMLLEASDELQAATKLLDQVMETIAVQKVVHSSPPKQHDISPVSPQESLKKPELNANQVGQKEYPTLEDEDSIEKESDISKPLSNAAYSAQIMRLSREGMSAEAISDELGVPAAQVRLMQLLQSPKV
ncbi:MAG: hypothetical protein R8M46_09215 [Ghiorsea sp.]